MKGTPTWDKKEGKSMVKYDEFPKYILIIIIIPNQEKYYLAGQVPQHWVLSHILRSPRLSDLNIL